MEDPSIVAAFTPSTINPIGYILTKTYLGPEGEIPTGPSFPRQFSISLDIPEGQMVTDLEITDILGIDQAFVQITSVDPAVGGTFTHLPPVGVASFSPDDEIRYMIPVLTGIAGNDLTITYEIFIPEVNASGDAILDPNTGIPAPITNIATLSGELTPADIRDATGTIQDQTQTTILAKAIAIQKSVRNVSNTDVTVPGNTLEYSLAFQISDYFSFSNLLITDILGDGVRFETGYAPVLSIEERGTQYGTGALTPGLQYTIDNSDIGNDPDPQTSGTQTLRFDISRTLMEFGRATPGGILQGGKSGENVIGATQGLLIYRAIILDAYTDSYLPAVPYLDMGDVVNNDVVISGSILDTGTLTPIASMSDDSQATAEIS